MSMALIRSANGPLREPSGWPVRMILIIARTARVASTTATIRKTTLIVPRTTCSGPVMVLPTPPRMRGGLPCPPPAAR